MGFTGYFGKAFIGSTSNLKELSWLAKNFMFFSIFFFVDFWVVMEVIWKFWDFAH